MSFSGRFSLRAFSTVAVLSVAVPGSVCPAQTVPAPTLTLAVIPQTITAGSPTTTIGVRLNYNGAVPGGQVVLSIPGGSQFGPSARQGETERPQRAMPGREAPQGGRATLSGPAGTSCYVQSPGVAMCNGTLPTANLAAGRSYPVSATYNGPGGYPPATVVQPGVMVRAVSAGAPPPPPGPGPGPTQPPPPRGPAPGRETLLLAVTPQTIPAGTASTNVDVRVMYKGETPPGQVTVSIPAQFNTGPRETTENNRSESHRPPMGDRPAPAALSSSRAPLSGPVGTSCYIQSPGVALCNGTLPTGNLVAGHTYTVLASYAGAGGYAPATVLQPGITVRSRCKRTLSRFRIPPRPPRPAQGSSSASAIPAILKC